METNQSLVQELLWLSYTNSLIHDQSWPKAHAAITAGDRTFHALLLAILSYFMTMCHTRPILYNPLR